VTGVTLQKSGSLKNIFSDLLRGMKAYFAGCRGGSDFFSIMQWSRQAVTCVTAKVMTLMTIEI